MSQNPEDLDGRDTSSPPYSLSVEKFREIPDEVQAYTFGDRITRSNFTSFLISSFTFFSRRFR